jgi:hypothetical protein
MTSLELGFFTGTLLPMLAVGAAIVGVVLLGSKAMDHVWGSSKSLSGGVTEVLGGERPDQAAPVVGEVDE